MRILYVHSTVLPPSPDLSADRFNLLSRQIDGDVLQPVWFQTPAEVEAVFGAGSYPVYTAGRFRYHWFLGTGARTIRQRLASFRFYLRKGLEIYRERHFDCIVAYSHMTTGLVAGILKLLTGTRLVIEIVTSPNLVYITERPKPRFRERIMKVYSDVCLHMTMLMADRAHFLYPGQLNEFRFLRNTPNSVFHEFVTVSRIGRSNQPDSGAKYVLLVGSPWYLKGADLLIRAFLSIAPDFPDFNLKLLGHHPDREELDKLTGGSPRVEILKARPPDEALKIIQGATVMVLPSRCEGMGRALLEGMSAAVPLIGSQVGGIPVLVRDGENGYTIPSGDYLALAEKLRLLLADPELRRRFGDAGYVRAHTELNEDAYVREFTDMIAAAVGKRSPDPAARS